MGITSLQNQSGVKKGFEKITETTLAGKSSVLFNTNLSGYKKFKIMLLKFSNSNQNDAGLIINNVKSGYINKLMLQSSVSMGTGQTSAKVGYGDQTALYNSQINVDVQGSYPYVEAFYTKEGLPSNANDGVIVNSVNYTISTASISSLEISTSAANFTAGTIELWGEK